ncbi:hypothetical protein GONAM_03_00330 [Gordonia namibiensis NBRC 108229]|uniref:Uncharacterized protein n=1 Tax=Gordonia namibiensis NBRC 108229 TaxID=1208314 RepID=K6XJ61_9ACTN|nr:hypothetical protein GONAM_03_00330 [Gordonia namibiensis NBRC 108229]
MLPVVGDHGGIGTYLDESVPCRGVHSYRAGCGEQRIEFGDDVGGVSDCRLTGEAPVTRVRLELDDAGMGVDHCATGRATGAQGGGVAHRPKPRPGAGCDIDTQVGVGLQFGAALMTPVPCR